MPSDPSRGALAEEFATAFSAVAQLPEPRFDACDLTALLQDAARLYGGSTRIQFRVEAERPVP